MKEGPPIRFRPRAEANSPGPAPQSNDEWEAAVERILYGLETDGHFPAAKVIRELRDENREMRTKVENLRSIMAAEYAEACGVVRAQAAEITRLREHASAQEEAAVNMLTQQDVQSARLRLALGLAPFA